jgi:hypothetical protein
MVIQNRVESLDPPRYFPSPPNRSSSVSLYD